VGIFRALISWLLKASPFPSESLDNLAEIMQVTKVLKISKLDRYYKVRFLQVGGMAFLDRVFFDAKYLETLLAEEVLAVGAHEFTHLNQRQGIKKFWRLLVPALLIGAIIGALVFFNFAFIDPVSFFNNWGKVLSSLFAAVFSSFFALIAGFYVNAKWLRQQETECDLSSVKFLNGEPMISALIKLNNLRPKKMMRLERLLPRLYPTLEQRINDIRTAAENKKSQISSVQ
jgi:Zn-dependent protease with chaperone function